MVVRPVRLQWTIEAGPGFPRLPGARAGPFRNVRNPPVPPLASHSPSAESATRHSLLLRVRDWSDGNAWREFVTCYAPRIHSWCRAAGLQEADAADVTQTVLVRLVQQLQQFEYDPARGRFRGWLRTVTRNVVNDLAGDWRRRGLPLADDELDRLAGSQPPASDRLFAAVEDAWREELLRTAESLVRPRVEPHNWEAWRLSCREGLAAAEVARRLGLEVADVYVAKSRILRLLREEVRRLDPDANS